MGHYWIESKFGQIHVDPSSFLKIVISFYPLASSLKPDKFSFWLLAMLTTEATDESKASLT